MMVLGHQDNVPTGNFPLPCYSQTRFALQGSKQILQAVQALEKPKMSKSVRKVHSLSKQSFLNPPPAL